MERAQKTSLIRQAYAYNDKARRMASCNHLYMGSMATSMLINSLGGKWPATSLDACLETATDEQLDAGLACCENIIRHGKLTAE